MGAGRPKGKNKFQISLSLTEKQREWLQKQPNSSDLVGGFIDALKSIEELTPEYCKLKQLQTKLDSINSKIREITEEKRIFVFDIFNRTHFKGGWVEDEIHRTRYYTVENFSNPEPIDNEGQILKRKLDLMTEAIKQLEKEAEKIKTELIQPTAQQTQS